MTKVFVSQPMKGKTKEEVMEERKQVVDLVEKLYGKVEVPDTFFEDAPADARPLWFLAKSLEVLSTCDVIVAAPGWNSARGCVIEMFSATNYGTPTLEVFCGRMYRANLNIEVQEDE